ncbi:MAG: CapA family protein [Bacillota bacterium]
MNFLAQYLLTSLATATLFASPMTSHQHFTEKNTSPDAFHLYATAEFSTKKTVSLLGVGDNLIHSSIYSQAQRRSTDGTYDFSVPYEAIADRIAAADIASVNQETMIANRSPSDYPLFNSPPELGDKVVKLGFDVVSIANNHMFDMQASGLQETITFFNAYNDIILTGAYDSMEDYKDIPTITKNNITFSFVAATQPTNGLSLPSSSTLIAPVVTDEASISELLKQVGRAERKSDITVVNMHWGTEYTHTPTNFQYDLAKRLILAGADVVFGHHPHVIQPVEYITRADGSQGIVVYSLGNFISAQNRTATMIGGMLDLEIEKQYGVTSIANAMFLPIFTHYDGSYQQIRIYPYDAYTPELAQSHGVRNFSDPLSYAKIYDIVTTTIDQEFLPEDFLTNYAP